VYRVTGEFIIPVA